MPARPHGRLEPGDRGNRCRRAVERPVEAAEGDHGRADRCLGVHHQRAQAQVVAERGRREHPQDEAVGREHDHQAGDHRAFPHPRGLVLEPVQAPAAGDEAVEYPVGQAENPQFLRRRRVDGEPVGVLRVALRLPDLLGVAVLPDRALAQQPVRREPRAGQHRRRPPGEAKQHHGLGEAREHVHQTGRDEVHRDRQRRTGHATVEVPGHLQISG